MSKVLVVGIGTPTFVPADRHFGPGRRTAHFAYSLADAGHDVSVLWRCDDEQQPQPSSARFETAAGASFHASACAERSFRNGDARRILDEVGPDVAVGATVHGSACLVGVAPSDLPIWADVFGDPMAEAQARAAVDGSDFALGQYWESLARVLVRADRFSAVSGAQAHALVGQLGLAARLTGGVAGDELVSVIPCAAERSPSLCTRWARGALVPRDAFVVLFSGSFNTWCDVETIFNGVERAMDLDATLHFVATGGAVPGHHERGVDELTERVAASSHRDRFHLLGWIAPERLAALYEESDVGLNVERELYERRLGGENRVAEWMAYGVPAVTTGASEMGRLLVDRGLAFGVRSADADDLCRTLVYLARDRARVGAVGEACREYAERRLGFSITAAPLLEWCAKPRAAASRNGRPRLALVSDPRSVSRLLEEYVNSLGPSELGYRSVRWLWRRLTRPRPGRPVV